MHTGTITFLFDSGYIATESWHFNVFTADEAMKNLREVAHERLNTLAGNISIVLLKVPGQPIQKTDWRGKGGLSADPRHTLTFRDDGWAVKKHLRGVPDEIFTNSRVSPRGLQAFQNLSRILNRCCCVIVREGQQPRTIRKIEPVRTGTLLSKNVKKARKKQLLALLGLEKGQQFWDALKEKQAIS